MVKMSVVAAVCVTLFISLFLPLIICIVYGVRNKGKGVWTAWLLGAAGFFVFQVVLRLPLLNLLSRSQAFISFAAEHYILYCLALAFTAGLFEAAGRYAVARMMKGRLTLERGIAAGMGHGGIEAIIIIGMTYINNLIYILMINTGSFDGLVEQTAQLGVDVSSLLAVKETFLHSGPVIFYLAGYERILTMIFHVALSLLVCYYVRRRKDVQGVAFCLLLHTAVDFVAPLINGMAGGYLGADLSAGTAYILIYGFLTFVAAASAAGIWHMGRRWRMEEKDEKEERGLVAD